VKETCPFTDRILRRLARPGYEPQHPDLLAKSMRIAQEEMGDFRDACKALTRAGRVVLGSANGLMLPEPAGKIVGVYRANPKGFGFVIPDTPNAHGDLYVPVGKSHGAITGDVVTARVLRRRRGRDRMVEGEIVEIRQRGQSRFVGQLRKHLGRWFVIPDGNALHVPIMIGDVGAKGAKEGDQVVVDITEFPAEKREGRGVIERVLGTAGDPEVDTQSIIAQYGLPGDFPPAVMETARKSIDAFDPKREMKRRQRLDDLTIITIDPDDARDFDDAISLTGNADGTCELGVHIADVAFFVREGTALDDEARVRGNSIYFPSYVIPMLPEVLSNGVCSLQEKQWRLTKSAFITYDKQGRVLRTRFANTIIKSAKRLTYVQAQQIIDGKPGRTPPKVVDLLKRMDALAKIIRKRRIKQGMLVLELPDVDLTLDEKGACTGVTPADDSFTHTIIEMFMVEANEAVCRVLTGLNVPHLRRIHDEPSYKAERSLTQFLRALEHPLPKDADRFAVQRLLDGVRGTDMSFPVNLAVLKSMQKAEYSPQRIGHYALASEHYTHFTSPIRRYPDLTIHRLLDAHVTGGVGSSDGQEPRRTAGRRRKGRQAQSDVSEPRASARAESASSKPRASAHAELASSEPRASARAESASSEPRASARAESAAQSMLQVEHGDPRDGAGSHWRNTDPRGSAAAPSPHRDGRRRRVADEDDIARLIKLGRDCSTTERRAEAASNELTRVKILRMLESRPGEVYSGIVTGVATFGIFVQLRRFLIEGVVRFHDLPDDWWDVDVSGGRVIGQRSGKSIRIGDRLKVVVAEIDVPLRELELALQPGFKLEARAKRDPGIGRKHHAQRGQASTRDEAPIRADGARGGRPPSRKRRIIKSPPAASRRRSPRRRP